MSGRRALVALAVGLALAGCDHGDADRTVPIFDRPAEVQDCVRDEDDPAACPPGTPQATP